MTSINLLKSEAATLFDSPPKFSEEERKLYFILPTNEEDIVFKQIHTKIGYILQQGYFLFQQKFFFPNQYHKEDIEYVTKLCGIERKIDVKEHNKFAYNRFKQLILEKFEYKSFSENKHLFEKEALELVKSSLKPKEIFYSLLEFLDDRKIEVPRYYIFAEVITNSLNLFEKNLIQVIDENLTANQKEILDEFMNLPLNPTELSSKNPYLITHLKKVLQATAPRKIKQSLDDFYIIKDLHETLYEFFKSDLLSHELINYYAVWVVKVEHIHFEDIQDIRNKRLYVVSFISYQYKIRQDYFVDTFLQMIQKYYNDAEKAIAQFFLQKDSKYERQEHFIKIRNILSGSKEQLDKINKVAFSDSYGDSLKMEMIKNILSDAKSNFHDSISQELDKLESIGIKSIKDQLFYKELAKNYRKIHNRIGGISQILEFNAQTSNSEIYKAVNHYQQKSGKLEGGVPMDFLNKTDQKRLYFENGELNYNLYKVLLFKEIVNHIKAGSLNLLFSERYKSIDEYLINWERWEDNKEELLLRAGLEKLKNPHDSLTYFKNNLHKQYEITNENSKDNQYLKFSSKGITKVSTPKASEEISEKDVILKYINRDRFFSLVDILSDIRYSIDYISSFSHYNIKNSKSIPLDETIYAAVIALGCNIGVRKMGEISEGIGAEKLEYTVSWFFSKKNIDEANQKIITLINSLPLSTIYLKEKEKLNTSSDGQKFDVTVPSLHASHSSKYFGTGKGVSAYSFIDEKGRLFYNTVISASERESSYVLDGLFYDENTKSDAHSTDTHGYSEIVFGICNSLGIEFTPRIKNYHEQLLYAFKERGRAFYEKLEYKILPSKSMYINEKIIVEQWEYILRLLCSIKLKETLPSNILKRLSSYSKQHPLYRAIKEVGRIHKSIFLLRYYDDVSLRQNIEKQLNKIELSHLFAKAVFFGNNQELKYATKEEQEIAVGCRHLIQNSIILWNYLFISEKLSLIMDEKELQEQISLLKNSSMMSWRHINMHGIYNFDIESSQSPFNLDEIRRLTVS